MSKINSLPPLNSVWESMRGMYRCKVIACENGYVSIQTIDTEGNDGLGQYALSSKEARFYLNKRVKVFTRPFKK